MKIIIIVFVEILFSLSFNLHKVKWYEILQLLSFCLILSKLAFQKERWKEKKMEEEGKLREIEKEK